MTIKGNVMYYYTLAHCAAGTCRHGVTLGASSFRGILTHREVPHHNTVYHINKEEGGHYMWLVS